MHPANPPKIKADAPAPPPNSSTPGEEKTPAQKLSRKEQTRIAQAKNRKDKKTAGLKAVKIWLTPEEVAYLNELQLIHRVTSHEKIISLLIDAERTGVKLVPKLAPNKFE